MALRTATVTPEGMEKCQLFIEFSCQYVVYRIISILNSLDTSARHEIRESYDVASPDGLYPDEHAPEFRQAINDLAPPMCELTFRLLKCMALALGKWIIQTIFHLIMLSFSSLCIQDSIRNFSGNDTTSCLKPPRKTEPSSVLFFIHHWPTPKPWPE